MQVSGFKPRPLQKKKNSQNFDNRKTRYGTKIEDLDYSDSVPFGVHSSPNARWSTSYCSSKHRDKCMKIYCSGKKHTWDSE